MVMSTALNTMSGRDMEIRIWVAMVGSMCVIQMGSTTAYTVRPGGSNGAAAARRSEMSPAVLSTGAPRDARARHLHRAPTVSTPNAMLVMEKQGHSPVVVATPIPRR